MLIKLLPAVEGREIFGQKLGEILQHRSLKDWKGELSYHIVVIFSECKEKGNFYDEGLRYEDTCRNLIGGWQHDWVTMEDENVGFSYRCNLTSSSIVTLIHFTQKEKKK